MGKKKELNFDLKQLRSYLEVLHEKSFTRASRNLKMGQATISHHIGLLEEMLGVRLINRTSKEISITPEGELFKNFSEELFDNIDTLKQQLKHGMFGGITKISASTIPATYIVPKIIARLKKKYPDYFYKVEISDSREVVESLKEGKIDIGLTGKKIKHSALKYHRIESDEILLVGPVSYPDTISISDLKDLSLVGRESGSGTRNAYEKELNRHGIVPSDLSVIFECTTTEGVKESVIAGIGAAFISNMAIQNEIVLKRLKIIEIDSFSLKRDFFLVMGKNKHISPPVRAFLDEVNQYKREDGAV